MQFSVSPVTFYCIHAYFSVLKRFLQRLGLTAPPFPLGYTSNFTYVSFFQLIAQFILLRNVSNIMLLLLYMFLFHV